MSTQHTVRASTFADPADVAAYRRAKARGASDQEAFRVGDNGVGLWGDDTTNGEPWVALPRDVLQAQYMHLRGARGAAVRLTYGGQAYTCKVGDTMPYTRHITNGCGIDLSPGAVRLIGYPEHGEQVVWEWL